MHVIEKVSNNKESWQSKHSTHIRLCRHFSHEKKLISPILSFFFHPKHDIFLLLCKYWWLFFNSFHIHPLHSFYVPLIFITINFQNPSVLSHHLEAIIISLFHLYVSIQIETCKLIILASVLLCKINLFNWILSFFLYWII